MPVFEKLEFGKFHGLGNDYIIIDDRNSNFDEEVKQKLAIIQIKK